MPPKKDTAHRPSQANQEFVTTADGRRVRNTAFTGKKGGSKTASPAAMAAASKVEPAAGAEERLFDTLDSLKYGSIEWDPAEVIDPETVVVSKNGNVVSASLSEVQEVESSFGYAFSVEAVHVVSGKPTQRGLKDHLTEVFYDMRNNEPKRYTNASENMGRFKQLVVTDAGEFLVDCQRGFERSSPTPYTSANVKTLDDRYDFEGEFQYDWRGYSTANSKTQGLKVAQGMMADVFVKAWKEVAASR